MDGRISDHVPGSGVGGGWVAAFSRMGRDDQRATAGRLMSGSSLIWLMVSSVMYLARCTAHSSFCSSRIAPTRRTMASLLGKMPTTSVLRLISPLRRSIGLVECSLARCSFGILFGKRIGGFAKRAEEIIDGELDASPTIQAVVEALVRARANILEQIRHLEAKVRLIARQNNVVRRLMSVPGVGVITALGFAATIDDPTRFKRSSSAGAYLGLTPRIYASGETMRSGRVSKRGDDFLRRSLYEAANALLTRIPRFSALKSWGLRIARRGGYRKAKVAVARKLAVILHATWISGEPFRWSSQEPGGLASLQ